MRVTKAQIIRGVTDYIKDSVLPQLVGARSVQIIVSIGANALAANPRLADALFNHPLARAVLDDDGSGTYDLTALADAAAQAVRQFGGFPIQVPAIPLISPAEFTLSLSADDVDGMIRRIEGGAKGEA